MSTPVPPPSPAKPGLARRAARTYLSWPMWAKVGAPVVLVAIGALAPDRSPNDGSTARPSVAAPLAALGTDPPAEVTATEPATTAAVTSPPTTAAPTTVAPTDPPPTTIATTPPTAPPETVPPATSPPATSPPATSPPATDPPATSPPPTNPPPTAPPQTSPPAPQTDPRFDTCKEAKAHGYGPYRSGVDPEYDWYRDADGDGKVCE